ncbi:PRC-barrel domain-containing protein [Henriciella marina]|uniref:PRC-barrel domain-containing protein n=1 Tax=Henriciella marina TaxID=453851 RepID=A0ABT4LUT9_9PROT|nr:PRC-barrel domain-containing protein [Henriciella marina]MCZ4298066.1 PRC-barrel domain-containing protein [Henriciella marina]
MPTPDGHTTAIRASRVIGTDVYSTSGDKIGEIEDVMLNKLDNQIMFAVVGFGGFLGFGEKFHAIPWSSLDYEKDKGGYIVPFSEEQLKQAPSHSLKELTKDDGAAARDAAFDYYKVERYWVVGAD